MPVRQRTPWTARPACCRVPRQRPQTGCGDTLATLFPINSNRKQFWSTEKMTLADCSLFASGWVLPRYDGRSIANIPATVAGLLGAPPLPGLPPLAQISRRPPAQRVIVLVLDAVGHDVFVKFFNHPLAEQAQSITSVFPSTTVAAFASLWTGRAPAQHGLVGTRMWMHDYGVLAQMISLKVARSGQPEQLVEMGLNPETFLPAPNLAEHLAACGIPTHDFIPHYFRHSGLTRILHRGAQHVHGVVNLS